MQHTVDTQGDVSSGQPLPDTVVSSRRRFPSVSDDVHQNLIYLLEDNHVPTRDRTAPMKKAYYYRYTYRDYLSVCQVSNPLTSQIEMRLLFQDGNSDKVIVLRTEEKRRCIALIYDRSKGEGARKIKKRIDAKFIGISEDEVQKYLNSSRINQKIKGRFENKPPLRPVHSGNPWHQIPIDVMSMMDKPVELQGKVYRWILSVIDVFSRYLILRPIYSKEAATIANELLQIFSDLGTPVRIQCDRGTEFRGSVDKVAGG